MDSILKKKLDKLLHSDDFEVLLKLYQEIIDKWNEQNVVVESEFDTLKLLFIREGKKQGLKEFLDFIENPI
jgi:vacuolar-type H+-ATPase subunit E/Vma4